ncbi:MAG TPA: histidine phosphatase family protein [Saprospiraceae bacterium]|nr:histidine phosphatase family protein [Saprospiraceae bacterium]
MAKTVFFIRHAKSSWSDPKLTDIKRPLNERGLRDAPFMAQLLRQQIKPPVRLLSSPAVRAFTTAKYFAKAFVLKGKDIETDERLYLAEPETILQVLRQTDNEHETLLVFGHNPGYTQLANLFSEAFIDNVPTCGMFEVQSEVDDWSDFGQETAKLVRFQYPKQYFT